MSSFRHFCFKHRELFSVSQRPLVINRSSVRAASTGGNPAQHCLELVKRTDHEHFLTNLLLPDRIRTDAFAIRALSAEVSGVRECV